MGQMQCIPFRLRKAHEAATSSLHHSREVQVATDFGSLPEDTKKLILSHLPVVDIVRSRLVCVEWCAILSSSSSSSASSHSQTDFWRSFWVKYRPQERMFFLHSGQNLKNTLLYDVHQEICYSYPACPKLPKSSVAVSCQVICNTTANGLVFLVREMRFGVSSDPPVIRIWTYNPLTGCQTRLPDVQIPWQSTTWRIFAKEDVSNRNMGPHYILFVLEKQSIPVQHQNLPQEGLHLLIYCSKERSWQMHWSSEVHRNWCHFEVNRFYEHDLILILEARPASANENIRLCTYYLSGFRDPNMLPPRVEADCYVKWFNVENYSWNSCSIFPPEDLRSLLKFKHFYLFDRNKELVLLAGLMSPKDFAVDFRVYKSRTVLTPGNPPSWMLLSSMPDAVAQSAGYCPNFQFGSRTILPNMSKFQVFPLPDKIQGDKLIIIQFQDDSFSVVSFNLESSPAEAWTTLTATPNVGMRDQQSGWFTPLEEKIGRWTRSITQSLRENSQFRSIYQSGSLRGFTLEPSLDDL